MTAEPWFVRYERDVRGAPGRPWPTKPRVLPTFIPDPLERRRTLLKQVASVLRALAGRWRR